MGSVDPDLSDPSSLDPTIRAAVRKDFKSTNWSPYPRHG